MFFYLTRDRTRSPHTHVNPILAYHHHVNPREPATLSCLPAQGRYAQPNILLTVMRSIIDDFEENLSMWPHDISP